MPTTKNNSGKKKVTKKKTTKKKAKRTYTKKVAKPVESKLMQTIQCNHCNKVSEVSEDKLTLINTINDEVVQSDGRIAIKYEYYVCRCPKCDSFTSSRKVIYRD